MSLFLTKGRLWDWSCHQLLQHFFSWGWGNEAVAVALLTLGCLIICATAANISFTPSPVFADTSKNISLPISQFSAVSEPLFFVTTLSSSGKSILFATSARISFWLMSPSRWGATLSVQWIMLFIDSWSLIEYTNITALALRKYVGGTVASKRSIPAVSYRVIW